MNHFASSANLRQPCKQPAPESIRRVAVVSSGLTWIPIDIFAAAGA